MFDMSHIENHQSLVASCYSLLLTFQKKITSAAVGFKPVTPNNEDHRLNQLANQIVMFMKVIKFMKEKIT